MADRLQRLLVENIKVVKFVIAGGSAAVINLVCLYILTEFFGLWYLASSALSFLIAFGVSFVAQKYWTFQDGSRDGMGGQLFVYLLAQATNLFLNTLFMYILVDVFGLWYMLAQIIVGLSIAVGSFIVYNKFIFKKGSADKI
ncbi:MAG: GtrA family protein [Candidatus Paceibacterota bacterium]